MKISAIITTILGIVTISATTVFAADSVADTKRSKAPERVYLFDARYLKDGWNIPEKAAVIWDNMHALCALQGIVNREKPQLYIIYCEDFGIQTDEFWMNWYRTEDGWLKNSEIISLQTVEDVFDIFASETSGLVVYDPNVNATACVASTASGCLNLIPVRYNKNSDSIHQKLLNRYHLQEVEWLVHPDGSSMFTGKGNIPDYNLPTTGSAKTDTYRWAIERYLKSNLCDPCFAGYYIDSFWISLPNTAGPELHTLSNQDYFIQKRAFFFDLSPWGDETPNDDPTQPLGADEKMFREIMYNLYLQSGGAIIKVGGFTPWQCKYTDHGAVKCKHDGVATEWQHGKLISQYNGYMEADAPGLSGMANASFHTHYPLKQHYQQPNPKPNKSNWKQMGYIDEKGKVKPGLYLGHYVGDYDAPSWLYKSVPQKFNDPARGSVPLGWAFNPNLSDRAPMAFVYAYQHATTNDFFITGDSGSGYLNPRSLTQKDIPQIASVNGVFPSGLDAWIQHCKRYMGMWDMSIIGFVLDGSGYASGQTEFSAFRTIAPDGCGTHFERTAKMIAGVPTCNEWDLNSDPVLAARDIAYVSERYHDKPGFIWCRSILKSPKWYQDVSDALHKNHPEAPVFVVDPYTFFGIIKECGGGGTQIK